MFEFEAMRIVHCVRAPIGGIFRHVVDLALAQTAQGHEVGIVCDSQTGGAFEAALIARVAPQLALGVTRVPMTRALSLADLAASWRIFLHIQGLAPDVLHGHGSKGGSYARLIGTALRLKGRRVSRIYCPHGGSLHYDPRSLEGRIYFTLERMLEHLTDGLVFVSQYEQSRYESKVGRPRVPTVLAYNGLRAEEYEPVTSNADAVDFLHIGMLRVLKGTDVFIRAIDVLRSRGITVRAKIVGIGDERATFETQVAALELRDRIEFLDPMPVREAMAMARTVVLPSRAESLPYVALETIAAERPLIATRVGGLPEIFDTYSDRLLPAGDVEAVADAMQATLADPVATAELAKALRRSICERFHLETMTQTIEAFYFRLFGEPAPRRSTPPAGGARTPFPIRAP
jgi:glycosyltransferase involved in cell wall biosynthesis